MSASLKVPDQEIQEAPLTEVEPTHQWLPGQRPECQDSAGHNIGDKTDDEGPNRDADLPGSLLVAVSLLEAPLAHAAGREGTATVRGPGEPGAGPGRCRGCPRRRAQGTQGSKAREKELRQRGLLWHR